MNHNENIFVNLAFVAMPSKSTYLKRKCIISMRYIKILISAPTLS